jgi:hypothetical protein
MADTIYTTIKTGGETVSTIISVQTINTTTAISTFFSYTELAVTAAGSMAIAAKQMVEMVVLVGTTQTYSIGTTLGGSEILSRNMATGTPAVLDIMEWNESAWTLHLTGTFTAYIYLR